MRVLLLTSPAPPQTISPFSLSEKLMPLGLGHIISVLQQAGHAVDFQDMYLKRTRLPEVECYDFVGIYASSICFRGTRSLLFELEAAKVRGWSGKVVVGGPHTSVMPETIPLSVDYVVQGEGELAMLDIVEGREAERLVQRPRITDLDSLPRPAYHLFADMPYDCETFLIPAKPVFPMNTSRGCPFQCKFCSVNSIWGHKYTAFSPERMVDDVAFLMREYAVQGVYFREDNFTASRRRTLEFCERALRDRISVSWACEARADSVDLELLQLMQRAGCTGLYLGFEAATQRLLDAYGKGITVDQIERVLEWCKGIGMNVLASFIVDTPQEELDDRVALLEFIQKHQLPHAILNHFTGIPGSELYEQVLREGQYEIIDDLGLLHMPHKPFPKHFAAPRRYTARRLLAAIHNPRRAARAVLQRIVDRL